MNEQQFPTYPEGQDYEDDTVYEPDTPDYSDMEGQEDDGPLDELDLATEEDDYSAEDGSYDRGQLHVHSVGVIYMRAATEPGQAFDPQAEDGYVFSCTAASIQLGINAIPQAVVYVSMGASVLSGEPQDAVKQLLNMLISRDHTTQPAGVDNGQALPSDLIRCALYEEATGESGFVKKQLIFDGYIVSGGPVYAANPDASMMQAMFVCCGKAAALMTAPGAAYVESYMSGIINRYLNNKPMDNEGGQEQNDLNVGMRIDSTQLLGLNAFKSNAAKRVAYKLALCTGAVRLSSAYIDCKSEETLPSDLPVADQLVLAAIGGSTKLKTNQEYGNGIPDNADDEYTKQLLDIFNGRMANVSIWETIVSVMSSDQFALHLIPRWHCDSYYDFRMEVCPSVAWDKDRPMIKLSASDIVAFRMDHRATDALNTPDVLFVNFHEAYPNIAGSPTLSTGVLGVASGNEKLNKELRGLAKSGKLGELNRRVSMYRVKEVSGPTWLGCVVSTPGVVVNGEKDLKSLGNQLTPAKVADETAGISDSTTQPSFSKQDDGESVYKAANSMAMALFLHYYMSGDNAVVDLLPDCRFGLRKAYCLENSLGETVDVDLSNYEAGLYLHVRGVITGLTYSYASGRASSAKYQMMLSRVRAVDVEKEPPVSEPCPIYSVDPPLEHING